MTNVADRVNYLIQENGYSDNAFMKLTGINNLGKKKKGLVGYTDSDIIRISNSLNISYTWLKNGCGELKNSTDEGNVIPESISNKIGVYINAHALTVTDIADKLHIDTDSVENQLDNMTFEFVQDIIDGYPTLSTEWLFRGKGNMDIDTLQLSMVSKDKYEELEKRYTDLLNLIKVKLE